MIRNFFKVLCVLITSFSSYGCASVIPVANKSSISPVEFGLLDAKTGEERYEILLRTHNRAIQEGVMVNYHGLQSIDLTIPKNASSIPLGPTNDFADVVFNVTNKSKEVYLFSYVNKSIIIEVLGKDIDGGRFLDSPRLCAGTVLLSIEDKNPWVENRQSYSYGHQRKDILLIKNGRAENQVVMPYDNGQSDPICKYYTPEYPYLQLSGLTLNRTSESTSKTYLCNIVGVDDVIIKNVVINTPQSDLTGDAAINIVDCTNVDLNNITINGTYSLSNRFGYGISMNNIWNFHANKLSATGNWGIFGNNNINTALIENSEINRFDIHCYGRDISFKKVSFFKLYNQFSSTYGTISFDECRFNHFIPVLYETSYNAYVPHSIIFNRCDFYLDAKRNYLISAGRLDSRVNSRIELSRKSWPNVTINKMNVYREDETDHFYIFYCSGDLARNARAHSIDSVVINGMTIEEDASRSPILMELVNKKIKTDRPLRVTIDGFKASPNSRITISFEDAKGENRYSIQRSSVTSIVSE